MNEQMKPINERMKNVINRNKHCKFIRKRSRTNICSIRHQLQRLREAKSIADHKHRRLSVDVDNNLNQPTYHPGKSSSQSHQSQ